MLPRRSTNVRPPPWSNNPRILPTRSPPAVRATTTSPWLVIGITLALLLILLLLIILLRKRQAIAATQPRYVAVGTLADVEMEGCFADSTPLHTMAGTDKPRFLTVPECYKAAAEGNFKFFAMQNGQPDGTAECYGSNNLLGSKRYGARDCGDRLDFAGWNLGRSFVNAVYNRTDVVHPLPATVHYEGCFRDDADQRAMARSSEVRRMTAHECLDEAVAGKYKYFAMQNGTEADGRGECYLSNNLPEARRHGAAASCGAVRDRHGQDLGAPLVNAVYTRTDVVDPLPEDTIHREGCFWDDADAPTMTRASADARRMTAKECMDEAAAAGQKYFALQNGGPDGMADCYLAASLPKVRELGAVSCGTVLDAHNQDLGGPLVNAVYNRLDIAYQLPGTVWRKGCFADDLPSAMEQTSDTRRMTAKDCLDEAVAGLYKYFALRNGDAADGMGECHLSNRVTTSTKYGAAPSCGDAVDGWSQPLGDDGVLALYNRTDAVDPLPAHVAQTRCLLDRSDDRSMTRVADGHFLTAKECMDEAVAGGYRSFGLQNGQPDGTAECYVTNNLFKSSRHGIVPSCGPVVDRNGQKLGGSLITAVYERSDVLEPLSTDVRLMGCYADTPAAQTAMIRAPVDRPMIIEECQKYAVNGEYKYFVMQNGQPSGVGDCYLVNHMETALQETSAECTESEQDPNGRAIGGPGVNAVYDRTDAFEPLPRTVGLTGCFVDTADARARMDRPRDDRPISVEACHKRAVDGNYKYFVMRNGQATNGTGDCYLARIMTDEIRETPADCGNTPSDVHAHRLGDARLNAVYDRIDRLEPLHDTVDHVGCYADGPAARAAMVRADNDGRPVSIERCQKYALDGRYKYFILRNGQPDDGTAECYLAQRLDAAIVRNKADCGTNYNENGNPLGGPTVNVVYDRNDAFEPLFPDVRLLGCFRESAQRGANDLFERSIVARPMTVEACQKNALDDESTPYKYFAVKNGQANGKADCFRIRNMTDDIRANPADCGAYPHDANGRKLGGPDAYAIYDRQTLFEPVSYNVLHKGCYVDSPAARADMVRANGNAFMTIEECQHHADVGRYTHFIVRNGQTNGTAECYLAKRLSDAILQKSTACGKATINNYALGDANTNSVYTRTDVDEPLPSTVRFEGCYQDREADRTMFTTTDENFRRTSVTECMQLAVETQSKYFAMQDGRPNQPTADCWYGNYLADATRHGAAACGDAVDKQGQRLGAPLVNAVYNRTNMEETLPSTVQPLMSCYRDLPNDRAMIRSADNSFLTPQQCLQQAVAGVYKYFALQNGQENGTAECYLSNSEKQATRHQSITCSKVMDATRQNLGGPLINAIYDRTDIPEPLPESVRQEGCFNDESRDHAMTLIDAEEPMTVSDCLKAAELGNYKYFALQNGRPNGTGDCYVSDNLWSASRYGTVPCQGITDIRGQRLGPRGANVVYNRTDVVANVVDVYGCYEDRGDTGMTAVNNRQRMTFRECYDQAVSLKRKYFAMQNGQADGRAECFVADDVTRAKRFKVSEDRCQNRVNGRNLGGPAINRIYDRTDYPSYRTFLKDEGCWKDADPRAMVLPKKSLGRIPLEDCLGAAMDEQYRYVATQNGTPDGKAECWLSNDPVAFKRHGAAECGPFHNEYGDKLGGPSVNHVYSRNGVFPTVESVGCFRDVASDRTMTKTDSSRGTTFSECFERAVAAKAKYFAVQNGGADGTGECWLSNSLVEATRYGPVACPTTSDADGFNLGGPMVNHLYVRTDVEPTVRSEGCWGDTAVRAMQPATIYGEDGRVASSSRTTFDNCRNRAIADNFKYFAMQNGGSDGRAECFMSRNLPEAKRYGSRDCGSVSDAAGHNLGAANVNHIYRLDDVPGWVQSEGCFNDAHQHTMVSVGDKMTYYECHQHAVTNGYKYFALQNGQADGTASCFVSNDRTAAMLLGSVDTKECAKNMVDAEKHNLGGSWINHIYNRYDVPDNVNNIQDMGCWKDEVAPCKTTYCDKSTLRAMTPLTGMGNLTLQECQMSAVAGLWRYFAMQNGQPDGRGECYVSNDYKTATQYGSADCGTVVDSAGNNLGGPMVNHIYLRQDFPSHMEKITDEGCWKDDPNNPAMIAAGTERRRTFDECYAYANPVYKYFALQDAGLDGRGRCFVSNNLALAKKYGKSQCPTGSDSLGRNLGGPSINHVYNITDVKPTRMTKFPDFVYEDLEVMGLGCYYDNLPPAMFRANFDESTYAECKQYAKSNGYKYFALQQPKAKVGSRGIFKTAQCFVSNNLERSTRYGSAICSNIVDEDGRHMGASWVNSLYEIVNGKDSAGDPLWWNQVKELGCYDSEPGLAYTNNEEHMTFDFDESSVGACFYRAVEKNAKYFSVSNPNPATGNGECRLSNDKGILSGSTQNAQCIYLPDNTVMGDRSTNFIHERSSKSSGGMNEALNVKPKGCITVIRSQLGNHMVPLGVWNIGQCLILANEQGYNYMAYHKPKSLCYGFWDYYWEKSDEVPCFDRASFWGISKRRTGSYPDKALFLYQLADQTRHRDLEDIPMGCYRNDVNGQHANMRFYTTPIQDRTPTNAECAFYNPGYKYFGAHDVGCVGTTERAEFNKLQKVEDWNCQNKDALGSPKGQENTQRGSIFSERPRHWGYGFTYTILHVAFPGLEGTLSMRLHSIHVFFLVS